MFTTRNPQFEANGGKVSIISHSLGEYQLICKVQHPIITICNVEQPKLFGIFLELFQVEPFLTLVSVCCLQDIRLAKNLLPKPVT